MKVIFLDIDGVLNSTEYFLNAPDEYLNSDPDIELDDKEERIKEWSKDIDSESVECLNKIIEATDAKVVLSSAWRNSRWEEVEACLKNRGFNYSILDRTPILTGESLVRGNEILNWIQHNAQFVKMPYYKYEDYLILDDSTDMLLWQKDNFYHVDNSVGLKEKDVQSCIQILGVKE